MCDAGLEELLTPKLGACKWLLMQDEMDKVEQNEKKQESIPSKKLDSLV